jgi:hypothetical protein
MMQHLDVFSMLTGYFSKSFGSLNWAGFTKMLQMNRPLTGRLLSTHMAFMQGAHSWNKPRYFTFIFLFQHPVPKIFGSFK